MAATKKGELSATILRKKAARENALVARSLVALAEILEGWDIVKNTEVVGEIAEEKKETEHGTH